MFKSMLTIATSLLCMKRAIRLKRSLSSKSVCSGMTDVYFTDPCIVALYELVSTPEMLAIARTREGGNDVIWCDDTFGDF